MFIARVLADKAYLQTRVRELRDPAKKDTLMLDSGAHRMLNLDAGVLEMEFPEELDADRLRAFLDVGFGGCEALMADQEIRLPDLVVSDMDSTMIGQECIDELADFAGIKAQIAAITERAMNGEIDFKTSLCERVALLEGLEESAITRCLQERIRPNPGARELIATLKAKGARTVLVTGGFHHFADVIGQQIGFDRVVGNRLEVSAGKLTGRLEGAISDADTKARVLREELDGLGRDAVSLAIGDGANDIAMIKAATLGFAYHAKPSAREAANGWIDQGNLSDILSLLGIDRAE